MVEQWDSNEVDAASQRAFYLSAATSTADFASRPATPVRPGPEKLFRYRFVKRGLDLTLVLLCLPVLLLLIASIALAIRLTSPGPIFFSHRRIRGHGRFFSMWKFRT